MTCKEGAAAVKDFRERKQYYISRRCSTA